MVDAGCLVDDGADQPLGLTGVERVAEVGVGLFDVAGKRLASARSTPRSTRVRRVVAGGRSANRAAAA